MPAVMNLGAGAPAGAGVGWVSPDDRQTTLAGVAGASGQPIEAATVFDLASVTKVVATTCALHRLAGFGQIDLTDPLTRYLGWLPQLAGVSLTDLAYHRAGLWEWQPLYLAGQPVATALAELAPRYPVGRARHYSDVGFMLLGLVVAEVAACPLDQAVTDLVLAPLRLERGGYAPVSPPVASGGLGDVIERHMVATASPYPIRYHQPDFAWRVSETTGQANDGNAFHAFGGVAGHAGLFANLDDLLTLLASLAGDQDFWAPAISARIFADGPDVGQAFGWRSQAVTYRNRPACLLWHPGFTGCAVGFIPGTGFGLALLSNRLLAPRPTGTAELWALTLAEVEALRPADPPTGVLP